MSETEPTAEGHDPTQAESLGETLLPATEPAAGSEPSGGTADDPDAVSGEDTGAPAGADPNAVDVEDR